jgi:hypothetical protein
MINRARLVGGLTSASGWYRFHDRMGGDAHCACCKPHRRLADLFTPHGTDSSEPKRHACWRVVLHWHARLVEHAQPAGDDERSGCGEEIMAEIRATRRGDSYRRGFRVAWLALGLASCADLLDLPSDPHLQEPAAEPVASQPVRGSSARDDEGAGPEPLTDGAPDTAPSSPGSVNANPDTDDPGPSPSQPSGGGGPEPIETGADAGVPPVAAPDAGAPEPPEEPEEPVEPVEPVEPSPCVAPEIVAPNGNCFLVVEEPLDWEDARDNCQARGDDWDLAAIRSAAVNDFVGTLTDLEAWLGGSDAASEGTWRWVSDGDAFWSGDGTTGEAVNGAFEAWNSNEPNGRGASDCARTVPIIRTGEGLTWADLECFELKASLCEGPPIEQSALRR